MNRQVSFVVTFLRCLSGMHEVIIIKIVLITSYTFASLPVCMHLAWLFIWWV